MTDQHQEGLQQAMSPATADPTRTPRLGQGDSNAIEPLTDEDREEVHADSGTASSRLVQSRL